MTAEQRAALTPQIFTGQIDVAATHAELTTTGKEYYLTIAGLAVTVELDANASGLIVYESALNHAKREHAEYLNNCYKSAIRDATAEAIAAADAQLSAALAALAAAETVDAANAIEY